MAEETKEKKGAQIRGRLNNLFAGVGRLTKIQRLLICLVTFLVIGVAYYFLIFSPRFEALETARKNLKKQEARLTTYKRQARSLAAYEKKMAEAQEEFNTAMKALPDKKELPALLTGISKAGTRSGLEILLFQPEPIVNKKFYLEIPLSMVVKGSYHQVADFFFQVANLNRIVNIGNMSMKKVENTKGRVQMKCSAATYMFTEPKPESGKGKKGKKKKKRG